MDSPLCIDLPDTMYYLKQSRPPGDTVSFQGRRNGKADSFLRPADIRDHQICGEWVQAALDTFNAGVKTFRVNTKICSVVQSNHPPLHSPK